MRVTSIALVAWRLPGFGGSTGATAAMVVPFWLAAGTSAQPGPWLALSLVAVLPRMAILARGESLAPSVQELAPAFGDGAMALLGAMLCGHAGLFALAWLSLLPLHAVRLGRGNPTAVWIGVAFIATLMGLATLPFFALASLIDPSHLDFFGAAAALVRAITLSRHFVGAQGAPNVTTGAVSGSGLAPLALANLNHELRTPLNAIIGFAGLMQALPAASASPARLRDYARMIEAGGTHMLAVLEASLGATAAVPGYTRAAAGTLDPCAAIKASLEIVGPAAAARGIAMTFQPPQLAVCARADQHALQQILINLISNAVKFSPAGATVGITVSRPRNSLIAIEVRDHGMGIEPDDFARLGQPLMRSRAAIEHKIEGSGLGLAICHQLAEAQGGQLILDSQPGAGTTARLLLPAAPIHVASRHSSVQPRSGTSTNALLTIAGP